MPIIGNLNLLPTTSNSPWAALPYASQERSWGPGPNDVSDHSEAGKAAKHGVDVTSKSLDSTVPGLNEHKESKERGFRARAQEYMSNENSTSTSMSTRSSTPSWPCKRHRVDSEEHIMFLEEELSKEAAALEELSGVIMHLNNTIKGRPVPGQRPPRTAPPPSDAPGTSKSCKDSSKDKVLPDWFLELPNDPKVLSNMACDHMMVFEQKLQPDRLIALMDLVKNDPDKADFYLRLRRDDVRHFWMNKMLQDLGFPAEGPDAS